jgi:hypothetical protein
MGPDESKGQQQHRKKYPEQEINHHLFLSFSFYPDSIPGAFITEPG